MEKKLDIRRCVLSLRPVEMLGFPTKMPFLLCNNKVKASGINPVRKLDPSPNIPPEWVAQAIAWLAGPAAFWALTSRSRQKRGALWSEL